MPKPQGPIGFCTFQGLQTATKHCATSITIQFPITAFLTGAAEGNY